MAETLNFTTREIEELLVEGKRFGSRADGDAAASRAQADAAMGHGFGNAVALINAAFSRFQLVPFYSAPGDDESLRAQLLLIHAFVSGVEITRAALLGGYSSRAIAVVRHEFEIASRLRQIRTGTAGSLPGRKRGGPRRVAHAAALGEEYARVYGELSEYTHLSTIESVLDVAATAIELGDGELIILPTKVPAYRPEIIHRQILVHLKVCLAICDEMLAILPTGTHPEHNEAVLRPTVIAMAMVRKIEADLLPDEGDASGHPD